MIMDSFGVQRVFIDEGLDMATLGLCRPATEDLTRDEQERLIAAITRRNLVISGSALAAVLASRKHTGAQTPSASPTADWTFTDDRGITVTLPTQPTSVVADMMIATALWDLGYKVAGVWGSASWLANPDWSKLSSYTGDGIAEVTLTDGWTPDLEQIAMLGPDLIAGITYFGDDFYFIGDGDQARLDQLAQTIGLSNGGVSIATLQQRVEELAVALGADVTQPEVIARKERFVAAETALKAVVTSKPDLKVLFLYGDPAKVYIANPNAWGDLRYFRDLGVNIVQTKENDAPDYYWEVVSWESMMSYPADLIMIGNEDVNYTFAENVVWKQLPAVKAGQTAVWGTNAAPSFQTTAYLLETLTAAIQSANVIV